MRLGMGKPIAYGASGIGKRLGAIQRLHSIHGGRLLDVGCGNGAYTLAMAPGFDEVHGIEIEPERLSELVRRLAGHPNEYSHVHAWKMDAEALDFDDESFDVVTAIEVIEHIGDLPRALCEIRRVLKIGGVFCVTCPNRWFPVETHSFRIPFTDRYLPGKYLPFLPWAPPLHRRLATARNFTRGELARTMAAHGLKEIGVGWVMPPFDNWALGRRFVRPVTESFERLPLRVFGVSVVGIYRRCAQNAA